MGWRLLTAGLRGYRINPPDTGTPLSSHSIPTPQSTDASSRDLNKEWVGSMGLTQQLQTLSEHLSSRLKIFFNATCGFSSMARSVRARVILYLAGWHNVVDPQKGRLCCYHNPTPFISEGCQHRPQKKTRLTDMPLQVQILLQRRGLSLNPVTTMYYIAPISFICLAIPWIFIEARPLFADEKVGPLLLSGFQRQQCQVLCCA